MFFSGALGCFTAPKGVLLTLTRFSYNWCEIGYLTPTLFIHKEELDVGRGKINKIYCLIILFYEILNGV
ncbi:hypothetical protein CGC56_07560 [Capnocytophaga canimorsus]|uniref:Uncharacterized protein n=1 Tax=Capnocytophaga canimorsus TaxID=28188 RepID=A0A250G751_9FLAO|nr:hypothetical protein CGC56_07560 [Capnocytophaga canimorsus]